MPVGRVSQYVYELCRQQPIKRRINLSDIQWGMSCRTHSQFIAQQQPIRGPLREQCE